MYQLHLKIATSSYFIVYGISRYCNKVNLTITLMVLKLSRFKLQVTYFLYLISISFLLTSCLEENETINPENLIKSSSDSTNLNLLIELQGQFKSLNKNKSGMEKISSLIEFQNEKSSLNLPDAINLVPDPALVSVKDSVAKLFDPDQQPCVIPEKVLKKLKKFKADNQAWVPRDLAILLNGMPDKALYMKGRGLTVVLHTVKVKHSDHKFETFIIIGAPTFASISIGDWVSRASDNNFGYTLDCSGLLNASIEGTATVPGADIKTAAASSMDKKSSLFVGAGVVISPLYAAYYGDASGIKISNKDRSSILNAILNTPGISDTDDIELIMSYEVVWASSKGEQGFNGSASFSAKGGLGIGIAQVAGSNEISGTVSRSSTFGSFDTYLTGRQRLNSPGHVTKANLRTLIQQLATP